MLAVELHPDSQPSENLLTRVSSRFYCSSARNRAESLVLTSGT